MSIKTVLHNFREIVWPLLEPPHKHSIQQLKVEDCKSPDYEIDLALEYIKSYQDFEENRRKDVESKATMFIGTFAVAITILINMAKDFIFASEYREGLGGAVVLFLSAIIIYLCRAMQFSVGALRKRSYEVVGFPKYMCSIDDNKKKKLLVDSYNAIQKNQEVINLKVDDMTMAQEYFIRAVYIVMILVVVLLLLLGARTCFGQNLLSKIWSMVV